MKLSYHTAKEKGFAMLFSVLVSSVLLSIGISIFNLTAKELILSSSGRESQFAFYAADTGIECALYWDIKALPLNTLFATSTGSNGGWRDSAITSMNPTCAGTSFASNAITPINVTSTSAQTQFSLTIPNTDASGASAPYCAIVTLTKELVGGVTVTTVDSRGYNTACNSTDPNRIERAFKAVY